MICFMFFGKFKYFFVFLEIYKFRFLVMLGEINESGIFDKRKIVNLNGWFFEVNYDRFFEIFGM